MLSGTRYRYSQDLGITEHIFIDLNRNSVQSVLIDPQLVNTKSMCFLLDTILIPGAIFEKLLLDKKFG